MSALTVVHVVRQFAPSVGGLEEAVLKLGLALRARGVTTSVVTLDRIVQDPARVLPRTETVQGLPVVRIPFTGSWRYPVAPAVLHHLAEADIVHVHAIDFFFDFLATTRPWHGKPMVASTHGGFFHTRFARLLKQAYFHTVTRASASAYHAICASSRSDLALFERIAPRRVALVENGVDTGKWAGLAHRHPQRTLLALGRFAAHKQLPKLFPLLGALRGLHPGWRLVIAGAAWDVPPAALIGSAAAAGVGDAVDILVQPSDDRLAQELRTASYVVSASEHEGFGLGVVEAMAAGLVPVLNDISAFRDLLARCSGCGCLVDIDRPSEVASAIERLHADQQASPGSARAAAIQAAGQFGWSASADLFRAHYRTACDAARTPRMTEARS